MFVGGNKKHYKDEGVSSTRVLHVRWICGE
jgi:hypothetical protein